MNQQSNPLFSAVLYDKKRIIASAEAFTIAEIAPFVNRIRIEGQSWTFTIIHSPSVKTQLSLNQMQNILAEHYAIKEYHSFITDIILNNFLPEMIALLPPAEAITKLQQWANELKEEKYASNTDLEEFQIAVETPGETFFVIEWIQPKYDEFKSKHPL